MDVEDHGMARRQSATVRPEPRNDREPMRNVLLPAIVAILFSFADHLFAQDWRVESLPSVGIAFDVPSRLERLPMQLGDDAIYHRARLRPKDDADFVRGQYYWYCDVYEFAKVAPKDGEDVALPDGVPPELAAEMRRMLRELGGKRHTSFSAWLDEQNEDDKERVKIATKAKARRGKAGKLDFQHWVWRDKSGFGPCGIEYCEAAVYTLGDREVALVVRMPLETEKPGVPKSKWKLLIDRMVPSGEAVEASKADELDAKRDVHANTPERQEALAAAKKNIEGLQGWDYFTSPNYIVIYSWDFEKPAERGKARKEAQFYSSRLEKMRELFLAAYPLDETGTRAVFPDPKSIPTLGGPITGEKTDEEKEEEAEMEANKDTLGKTRYSVFRLCATYEQFQKYGQSPPGVVGWFSPASKELVVFLGGDKMMGPGATETVTFHEGWHQYADFYFDHPQSKRKGSLHRWFDEGHGDYFGSFRLVGDNWKYVGSKMRFEDVKNMARVGDFVPFQKIVFWDRRQFYSERAPYYYAQAFSMIDYLRRGQKSRAWKPEYGEILDMYRKVMLVHGDSKLASQTAFRNFKDEDWRALEAAWKAWVTGPDFLSGK
jgi:hypothetical protein